MWRSIFLFELRYQLRQPLFYLAAFFLSAVTFVAATRDGVGRGGGQLHLNAPVVTLDLLAQASLVGLFVVVAFVASAAVRDFARGTSPLVFSKPVSAFDYLTGRLAGGLVVSFAMYAVCALALAVSTRMPWLDPELVGPFHWAPYLFALGVVLLPTLVALGAIAFAIASWTRSLAWTYVAVVGCFVLSVLAGFLATGVDSRTLVALLDPFGIQALREAVESWSVAQRNSALPELGGLLLAHRLVWMAAGLLFLGLCIRTFDPTPTERRAGRWRGLLRRWARRPREEPTPADLAPRVAARKIFTSTATLFQLARQTRLEVRGVLRNLPFLAILALGLVVVVGAALSAGVEPGTEVEPTTALMLEAIQGGYAILLVIVVMIYSGELVWRERSTRSEALFATTPTPDGVFLGAKLIALGLVLVSFLACGVLATTGVQIWRGHHDFEPGLYALGAALLLAYPAFLGVLASFFQIVARSKFLGYGLVLLFVVGWDLLEEFDLQRHLYRFASLPEVRYSPMNGYGPFLNSFLWHAVYWGFACAVLVGLSILAWPRGADPGWRARWRIARRRFRGPVRALLVVGVAGVLLSGGWIVYNTDIANAYVSDGEAEARSAAYETKYRGYLDAPLPEITAVRADVDLFPREGRARIRGVYRLRNPGREVIRELPVQLPRQARLHSLVLPAHRVATEDAELGFRVYRLDEPLAPGATLEMVFETRLERRGFVNHDPSTAVVDNGTFIHHRDAFPTLGYDAGRELEDPVARRRHGLPPARRFAERDDPAARHRPFRAGPATGWVDFETTVSTPLDQVAVTSGDLVRQWTEDGRRHFHYRMQGPMLGFFAYASGRYAVAREVWNGIPVEVYHHPDHGRNVPRMLEAARLSLDAYSRHFGPYPFGHLRIVETPGTVPFGARAYPGWIAFSERAGFLTRIGEESPFDAPFRRTAHEVAHQWWGHQVIGADVQGATMLTETLAQYSALLVMEEEFGPDAVRDYLRHERRTYLRQRGGERVEEMPLARVENQPYIHYDKGSVAMFALKAALGEDSLNRALRRYVTRHAFGEPPFPTTRDLLAEIRRETPEEAAGVLDDWFESLTHYDTAILDAIATQRRDGTFRLRLAIEARKLRADGAGVETEVPLDTGIDVAVYGEDGLLHLERMPLTQGRQSVNLEVPGRPTRVELDPHLKLLDREPEDNTRWVDPVETRLTVEVHSVVGEAGGSSSGGF